MVFEVPPGVLGPVDDDYFRWVTDLGFTGPDWGRAANIFSSRRGSPDAFLKANADGSYTIWFGPRAPAGEEGNWVQTLPDGGSNVLLRLYGPLEPWFDKTWKPGDFELADETSGSP